MKLIRGILCGLLGATVVLWFLDGNLRMLISMSIFFSFYVIYSSYNPSHTLLKKILVGALIGGCTGVISVYIIKTLPVSIKNRINTPLKQLVKVG